MAPVLKTHKYFIVYAKVNKYLETEESDKWQESVF